MITYIFVLRNVIEEAKLSGGKQMKIFIINLSSAKERLKFQKKQMETLGLEYERVEATSSESLPHGISNLYWNTWQRALSLGERACLLSHRNLWEYVYYSNKPALILEDDVLLSTKISQFLLDLDKTNERNVRYHHLSLEVRSRKKQISVIGEKFNQDVNIYRMYQDRTGAAAYILWPAGAKELLHLTERKAGLADAIICSAYNMHSYQVEPALAVQFDVCIDYNLTPPFNTTSATRNSIVHKELLTQYMIYKYRRIIAQFSLGIRQLKCSVKSKRRYVNLSAKDYINFSGDTQDL